MKLRSIALLLLFPSFSIAVEKFEIDPGHSTIRFSVLFAGLTEVEGRFTKFEGTILGDEKEPERSIGIISVDASSLDTANTARDTHLKTEDFFDVESFKLITFETKDLRKTDQGYTASGSLSLHGITKEISIPISAIRIKDNRENIRLGIKTNFQIKRSDFSIGNKEDGWWNDLITPTDALVGEDVNVEIRLQGVIWNTRRFSTGPNSLSTVLLKTVQEKGIQQGLTQYTDLKTNHTKAYEFTEDEFDALCRKLIDENKIDEAAEFFKIGLNAFPRSTSLYNRLADMYAASKKTDLACLNYKKVLEIDPANTNSRVMTRSLSCK
jgi:polyisoprenoid-binding protein YceI